MEEPKSQVKIIFQQMEPNVKKIENRTERAWSHGHRASIQKIRNHSKRTKSGRQKIPQRKMQENFPELKDTEPPDRRALSSRYLASRIETYT